MDIRKIKKLIELLENTDVSEIEIIEGEESVRITRPGQQPIIQQMAPMQAALPMHTAAPAQNFAPPAVVDNSQSDAAAPTSSGKFILSPMVGTFYSAPNPDAAPFVKVGQKIKLGDPVCIVEAMKMFNRIEADVEGTITKVLLSDGEPVEFDQPLFEVE